VCSPRAARYRTIASGARSMTAGRDRLGRRRAPIGPPRTLVNRAPLGLVGTVDGEDMPVLAKPSRHSPHEMGRPFGLARSGGGADSDTDEPAEAPFGRAVRIVALRDRRTSPAPKRRALRSRDHSGLSEGPRLRSDNALCPGAAAGRGCIADPLRPRCPLFGGRNKC